MPLAASRAAVGLDSAASTMTGRCKTSSPLGTISADGDFAQLGACTDLIVGAAGLAEKPLRLILALFAPFLFAGQ